MQTELPLIGAVSGEIKDLPWNHVAACDTEQAAMRMCIRCASVYRTQANIGDLLGMTRAALTTILNSDQSDRIRYMGRKKQNTLQRICGNRAIDQWADLESRGMLNCQRSLDNELAAIEARRAELLAQRQAG